MSARLAILCPGQGGQQPGVFDLALGSPAAAAALRDWPVEEAAGMALAELRRMPETLYRNRTAQPLVVAAALALWEAVRHALPAPALVAGYSVGELAAHAVAGALAAPDVIRLAAVRARLMDACVQPGRPQGLLAVSRVDGRALASLLPRGELYPAIETGESSFIVGGLRQAMPALRDEVVRRGGQARELPVEVASHTPFMRDAARNLLEELERSPFSSPLVPVLSGIAAEPIRQRGEAIATLARQTEQAIRWSACMDVIAESGITVALELGPGAALTRMLRERHPHIECRSASEFHSLSGLEAWIVRRL